MRHALVPRTALAALRIVGAGMMGDRADAIFAPSEEIGAFVKAGC